MLIYINNLENFCIIILICINNLDNWDQIILINIICLINLS